MRIRTLIFFLLITETLNAQSVEKSFKDTTLWHMNSNYTWTEGPGGPVHTENFDSYEIILSDTIISDTLYQKLYSSNSGFTIDSAVFSGYFKKTDNRVYFGNDIANMELMYDFNLTVGDTFRFNSFNNPWEPTRYWVEVVSVDSIKINGENRKRIIFEDFPYEEYNTGVHAVWVEGVGDYNYGLIWDYGLILYCAPMGQSSIVCFSENNTPIMGDCQISTNITNVNSFTEDIKIYPNPFYDNLYFEKIKGRLLINIYDLSGALIDQQYILAPTRLYLRNLTNGIYLLDIVDENNEHFRKKIIKYSH